MVWSFPVNRKEENHRFDGRNELSILLYRTVSVEENLCKQLGADPAYTKMLTHSAKFRWHFFSLYPWHKWFSLWSLNVRWFFIKRTMAFFLGQDQTEFWCLTEMSLQIFVWYGTPWQCTALCSAETQTTGTPLSPSGAEVKFSLDLCSIQQVQIFLQIPAIISLSQVLTTS